MGSLSSPPTGEGRHSDSVSPSVLLLSLFPPIPSYMTVNLSCFAVNLLLFSSPSLSCSIPVASPRCTSMSCFSCRATSKSSLEFPFSLFLPLSPAVSSSLAPLSLCTSSLSFLIALFPSPAGCFARTFKTDLLWSAVPKALSSSSVCFQGSI